MVECNMVQKESGLSSSFEILLGQKVIASAFMKNNIIFGSPWEYFDGNDIKYKLVYKPAKQLKNFFREAEDKIYISYDILEKSGKAIGSISQKQYNGGIFNKFEYFELEIEDSSYQLYVVGLGNDGIKFPIYKEDKQVALIEKGCVVYNNLDEYEVSSLDEPLREIACLFCLYIDSLMFGNQGEIMKKSVSKTYNLTTNKTLKSKFDPEFKTKLTDERKTL